MPKYFVPLISAMALVAATAVPAFAQEGDKAVPAVELSGGYGFLHDYDMEESIPAGWYASAAANLTRWFGVVGDVTGSHKTFDAALGLTTVKGTLLTGMGGPRFFTKQGRFIPYGQFLVGIAHVRGSMESPYGSIKSHDTYFAMQPGGGVSIYFNSRVGAQVAADYRVIDPTNLDNKADEFRFTTGVVVGFGSR